MTKLLGGLVIQEIETIINLRAYDSSILEKYGLDLKDKDIKVFLNYPNIFWDFISTRTKYLNNYMEFRDFYGVYPKFDLNNYLIDVKVIVPRIINLATALINIHEFKHAYDLYNILGNKLLKEDIFYENEAIKKEQQFIKYYLKK